MEIVIIDYRMSNMFSIKNALNSLGFKTQISSDPKTILAADGAVLPGVGSFPDAMMHLKELNLRETVKEFISTGKPFLGICLGLQLLFSKSEEFGHCEGLGVIAGTVENFSKYIAGPPIPHVGWNTVYPPYSRNPSKSKQSSLGIAGNDYYYFVHSFFVKPVNRQIVATLTRYAGYEFCSAVTQENVFACQFHPEKSGEMGLRFLKNYFS